MVLCTRPSPCPQLCTAILLERRRIFPCRDVSLCSLAKPLPPRKDHEKAEFEVHEVYAIDVLVSTGEGKVSVLQHAVTLCPWGLQNATFRSRGHWEPDSQQEFHSWSNYFTSLVSIALCVKWRPLGESWKCVCVKPCGGTEAPACTQSNCLLVVFVSFVFLGEGCWPENYHLQKGPLQAVWLENENLPCLFQRGGEAL